MTEIKIHVYAKRQTSDSGWEFLRIEDKQIKPVQKKFLCIKLAWNYLFFSWNNKQLTAIKGKLGHVVQIRVCRFA